MYTLLEVLRTSGGWPIHSVTCREFLEFIEDGGYYREPRHWLSAGWATVGERDWQWTSSAYDAYPGYRVPEGAIGEYNGKFLCG